MSCSNCDGFGIRRGNCCGVCGGTGVDCRESPPTTALAERERAARLVESRLTGSEAALVARMIRGQP